MGVSGLLRTLRPVAVKRTPPDLAGLRVAVDGYGWLHKAAAACAEDLVLGKPTTRLVEYFEHKIRIFARYGVVLVFVFDGAPIPAKARTEQKRGAAREAAAAALKSQPSRARELAQKALDIRPEHAAWVIALLQAHNIQYVVAPYEADAQLVYLERTGAVDAILSEDSDLLVFGASRLLTKLEPSGSVVEICASELGRSAVGPLVAAGLEAGLRLLAILVGCDYSPGVQGIGPVKAVQLVSKGRTLENVLGGLYPPVSQEFINNASRAELAFQFQRVWDPEHKRLETLRPDPPDCAVEDIIGPIIERSLAEARARGRICPLSGATLCVPPYIAEYCRRATRLPICVAMPRPGLQQAVTKARALRTLGPGGSQVSPFWARRCSTAVAGPIPDMEPVEPVKTGKSENAEVKPEIKPTVREGPPLGLLRANERPGYRQASESIERPTKKHKPIEVESLFARFAYAKE